MKTEVGSRKLVLARQTATFLLFGLLVSLVASGYYKIDIALCVQAYGIYAASLCVKDGAFAYGNAKEHAAKKPDA